MDMDAMTSQVESAWAAKERARKTSAELREARIQQLDDFRKRRRLQHSEEEASTTHLNPAVPAPATSDTLSHASETAEPTVRTD